MDDNRRDDPPPSSDDQFGGEPFGKADEDEWGQVASPESEPGEAARPARRGALVTAGLGALAVAGLLAVWLWLGREAPPAPAETVAEIAEPEPEPVEETLELPPLDASDAFLRDLLATLTNNPDALAWLLGDSLARQIAVAVDNLADGVSPRRALRGLAPEGDFRVTGEGEDLRMDPSGFERYDSLAAAIGEADIPALARTILEVLPLMDQAYAELGRPDRTFAEALLLACDRLARAPVPELPILLDAKTLRHEFRDPALEALDEASKHLLRFGPDNQRRIGDALGQLARELRSAA